MMITAVKTMNAQPSLRLVRHARSGKTASREHREFKGREQSKREHCELPHHSKEERAGAQPHGDVVGGRDRERDRQE